MDKYIISMYGAKNLDKVKTNLKNGTEESKRRFIKKYPYANPTSLSSRWVWIRMAI
jgi:hypothetical protein